MSAAMRAWVPSLAVADHVWPQLSERFGITPADVSRPPERGGLTWGQVLAYVARLNVEPFAGRVRLA